MPWPFTNGTVAPDFEIGPGAEVLPASPDEITTDSGWLLGAHLSNTGAGFIEFTLTDGAGREMCRLQVPPGGEQPYEWAFRPFTGLRWAGGAGLIAHLWGYRDA